MWPLNKLLQNVNKAVPAREGMAFLQLLYCGNCSKLEIRSTNQK
ncbi:hypothetical protein HMPREF0083_04237 [Aneurinibacillus aneurinilyticus ATCC 12856]|jgi:hypothetical protein|uniref:Uncharacterized protein n=1 Tax=Aneurinibacillus aneurinilyticus ATCC 12856 TaxID=649747 RepID=U1Y6B8_ANEAE|nr:hypothetical protein HMPREF0083_04237 [Aneurinibacillus aneurinilyticus ATCC 12856]